MKNYFLTFMLAVLVVLTAISLRHSVAGMAGSSTKAPMMATGGEPPPTLPPQ